jgi:hypothetical protein
MADLTSGDSCAGQVQQVFLLEGEACGGLILSADRMQQLPPWPEGAGDLLDSVCAVLLAVPTVSAAQRQQAEHGLEGMLAEAGRRLERCTGRLKMGSQVIYLGKAGGFICGPMPWTQPKPLSAALLAPPTPVSYAPHSACDDPVEQLWGWERAR